MIQSFKKLIHKIMHLFHINEGRVVSWRDRENVYIAFRCAECGVIERSSIECIKINNLPQVRKIEDADL